MSKKDQKKTESQIEEVDLMNLSPDGLFDLGKIRDTTKDTNGTTKKTSPSEHNDEEEEVFMSEDTLIEPLALPLGDGDDIIPFIEEEDFLDFEEDDFEDEDEDEEE